MPSHAHTHAVADMLRSAAACPRTRSSVFVLLYSQSKSSEYLLSHALVAEVTLVVAFGALAAALQRYDDTHTVVCGHIDRSVRTHL